MEVGEPAAVMTIPPDTEVEFEAELVAIDFKGSLKTARAKAAITGPHWQQGQEAAITDDFVATAKRYGIPTKPYSKRAAVYLVKGAKGAKYDVEVKVKVTKSKNVSGDAKLTGDLGGVTVEGTCPTSVGEHTVAAKIIDPPADIQSVRGRGGWGLAVPSANVSVIIGTSLVEVYFILGPPVQAYNADGVWSEALRFLYGRGIVVGQKEPADVTVKVTTHCHSNHRLKYDTWRGMPRYGVDDMGGGIFALKDYLERAFDICNCYDQCSAVHVLAGAVGVHLDWLFLKPFGYIKPTDLVGVGQCNNPFFRNKPELKMVDWDDPGRSGFGNHAFPGPPKNAADACAGPHLGHETRQEYVVASIDDRKELYVGHRPGKFKDIVIRPDVEEVE